MPTPSGPPTVAPELGSVSRHQIIVHCEIAASGVGIDRAIQMASAIEVVSEIQSEAAAQGRVQR